METQLSPFSWSLGKAKRFLPPLSKVRATRIAINLNSQPVASYRPSHAGFDHHDRQIGAGFGKCSGVFPPLVSLFRVLCDTFADAENAERCAETAFSEAWQL
jgi:hypothetical protein